MFMYMPARTMDGILEVGVGNGIKLYANFM